MKRSPVMKFAAATAAVAAVAACGTAGGEPTGTAPVTATSTKVTSPPATSSHTQTAGEACHALAWPLPAPDFHGKTILETNSGDLFCFTINDALAPDGHNVADDPMNQAGNWTVVAQEPAPGTFVGETTPILLRVVPKIRS
jgi:hypothetical protein